jgi:hypothetical protein
MYFITCFYKYEPTKFGCPDIGSARTFGYYTDRDVAIRMVELNNLDIQERLYNYAVVEYIPEGLYNPAEEKIFFKWNEDKRQFERFEGFKDYWGNYAFG